MLFGYAETVLAGFLITRTTSIIRWLLLGTWILSRLAIFVENSYLALILGISFTLAILVPAAIPLLHRAKRKENYILPVILLVLFMLDIRWWTGALWLGQNIQQNTLLATVDLYALLLLIVGGRAVRSSVGGYLERNRISRRDYSRFNYELSLSFLGGISCLLDVFDFSHVAGVFNILTAIVAMVRVLPWQLSYVRKSCVLLSMTVGYCWLIPGLLIKGGAVFWPEYPVAASLHGITVGALGTLTLTMMARTVMLQSHQSIRNFTDIGFAVGLIFIAAILRLIAPFVVLLQTSLLWIAIFFWSTAFILLLRKLLSVQGLS